MKILQLTLVFFLLLSCNSDKISEKSIELNNKAVKSITEENYDDAMKFADEAIKADEKNYNAYTIKAQLLVKENKLDEAENVMKRQLKIKPDFAEGWTFKGLINDLNDKEIDAKKDYRKSVELFEIRNKENEFNPKFNDTNIYFSLLFINDNESIIKMTELENKWKNDKPTLQTMLKAKEIGKKEFMKQFLID